MTGEALASDRPGFLRRLAEGAWHVPAGFAFLFRNPRLLSLALLPALLAGVFLLGGLVLGVVLGPEVNARFAPSPDRLPPWLGVLASLLLWIGTIGASVALGFAVALVLSAPILELLSRRVEARVRGRADEQDKGLSFAVAESLRGAFYFLIAAPGVFLLGLIPVIGPVLAMLWGARALSFQFTDLTLGRRGLAFREKRAWHRQWLPESEGFGLAGMVTLLVPLANFLMAPALAAGATLLVLELEDLATSFPRLEAGAPEPEASP
jgi:CysZ protein